MGGCASTANAGAVQAPRGVNAARFEVIRDRFETLTDVQQALRKAGLESSDVVLAIDLTKSNEWSGAKSFNSTLVINTFV
jgi:hypothetical protein